MYLIVIIRAIFKVFFFCVIVFLMAAKQTSKRASNELFGRNDANIKVIIPAQYEDKSPIVAGDFVRCRITESNSQVLKAQPLHSTQL